MTVAEYEVVKAEHDLERACLNQMVNLESTLHDSRPLVQEVTTKLGIFASVWAAVRPQYYHPANWIIHSLGLGFRSRRTYEN